MSAHDMVEVTFSLYGMRFGSNTHSGFSLPLRQCATASIGLLTVESMCLPTSCTATSPPPLKGMYTNFAPVAFSRPTVRIWSSCLEPVPPILNLPAPPAFTAARYDLASLYGVSALTH